MHHRWTSWFVVAALLMGVAAATATTAAFAADKHAFVVGIDRYDQLPLERQLRNAVSDARAVGAALQRLGYTVTTAENVGRLDLARGWQSFLNRIRPGDVAAFFFAGHGVEIGQANYLLPRDVPTVASGEEEVLKLAALPLSGFLDQLRARNPQVALHILDACRDNPFVDARGRSIGASRGLARIEAPRGTFVMFSAGAGQSALDRLAPGDPEPNSVYTRTLLRHLQRPGLGLSDIAREVRAEVLRLAATARHEQTPSYYDEMIGRFCPAGCEAPAGAGAGPPPPVVVDPCAHAAAHWQGAVAVGTLEAFEDHIRRFPNCTFSGLAKAKVEELRRPKVAAVPPAPAAREPERAPQGASAPPPGPIIFTSRIDAPSAPSRAAPRAGNFPNRPIQFVVPFAPGGSSDILARTLAQPMAHVLGQSIIILNRPGAGGAVGAAAVKGAARDGYTVLFGPASAMAVGPLQMPSTTYDPVRDFAPVGLVGATPLVVAARSGLDVRDLRGLLGPARARPGQLTFGSPGNGTLDHLACDHAVRSNGGGAVHVPYAGSASLMQAMIGGQIDFGCMAAAAAAPQAASGQIKVVAVSSTERLPSMRDVPTAAEAGISGFTAMNWNGLFVPRGTPQAVIDRLNHALQRTLDDRRMRQRLEQMGLQFPVAAQRSPKALETFLAGEIAQWRSAVRAAGLAR